MRGQEGLNMVVTINDIRQRLRQLSLMSLTGRDFEDFKVDIIADMAKLSYEQVSKLRSECDPDWLKPEWYDSTNNDFPSLVICTHTAINGCFH